MNASWDWHCSSTLKRKKPAAEEATRWAWQAYCMALLCANELIYVD